MGNKRQRHRTKVSNRAVVDMLDAGLLERSRCQHCGHYGGSHAMLCRTKRTLLSVAVATSIGVLSACGVNPSRTHAGITDFKRTAVVEEGAVVATDYHYIGGAEFDSIVLRVYQPLLDEDTGEPITNENGTVIVPFELTVDGKRAFEGQQIAADRAVGIAKALADAGVAITPAIMEALIRMVVPTSNIPGALPAGVTATETTEDN